MSFNFEPSKQVQAYHGSLLLQFVNLILGLIKSMMIITRLIIIQRLESLQYKAQELGLESSKQTMVSKTLLLL